MKSPVVFAVILSWLVSGCVSITLLIGSILLAAPENNSEVTPSIKCEILDYNEYTEQARDRIIDLRKTIYLAKNTHEHVDAYVLFLFMKSQKNTYFNVDRESLSEEEKMEVEALGREMFALNLRAFVALKKACERIVAAKGYGSSLLHAYYEEKLNELKRGKPLY